MKNLCFKCEKFGHTHNFFPEWKKIQEALVEIKDENFAFLLEIDSTERGGESIFYKFFPTTGYC